MEDGRNKEQEQRKEDGSESSKSIELGGFQLIIPKFLLGPTSERVVGSVGRA